MIEPRILQRATIVGTVLQIAWMLLGHFFPGMRGFHNVYLFGGMMISAIAGYIYAMAYGAGFKQGALGGAIAGGVCGLIGIAASVLIGDTPFLDIALGTAVTVLTGAVGGLWGEVAARMTRMGK